MTQPTHPPAHAPAPAMAPKPPTKAADDIVPMDDSDPRAAHASAPIGRPDPDKPYPEGAPLSAAPSAAKKKSEPVAPAATKE